MGDPFSHPNALELFMSGGAFDMDMDMNMMSQLLGVGAAGEEAGSPTPSQMGLLFSSQLPGGGAFSAGDQEQVTLEVGWRCLDARHPEGCLSCTPPPPSEETARFELIGDPGQRNGEKKLRSLLTRTVEWASSDDRSRAAQHLQGQHPRLAASLRARTSSSLSKELMLALLAHWGYKSDLWVRRGNRPSRSATPHVPRPAELPADPRPGSNPGSCASAEAPDGWAAVHEQLQSLSKTAFDSLSGRRARVAAEESAEVASEFARELPQLNVLVQFMRQVWVPAISRLLTMAMMGSFDSAAAERCALVAGQIVETGRRTMVGFQARTQARLADPACTAAQSVWMRETVEGQAAETRLYELLQEYLKRPAPAAALSATTIVVAQFLTLHLTVLVGAVDTRIAWVTRLAGGAGTVGVGLIVDTSVQLRTLPPLELTMDNLQLSEQPGGVL